MDSSFIKYVETAVSKLEPMPALDFFNELRNVFKNLLKGYVAIFKDNNLLPQDTGITNILVESVKSKGNKFKTRFVLSDFGVFQTRVAYIKANFKFKKYAIARKLCGYPSYEIIVQDAIKMAGSNDKYNKDEFFFKYQVLLNKYSLDDTKIKQTTVEKLNTEFESSVKRAKETSVINVAEAVLCLYASRKEKIYISIQSGNIKTIAKKYLESKTILLFEMAFLNLICEIADEKYKSPEEVLKNPLLTRKDLSSLPITN